MRTAHLLTVSHSTAPHAGPTGHVTWDACWEAGVTPPPCGQNDQNVEKNITLPQISFGGGKYMYSLQYSLRHLTHYKNSNEFQTLKIRVKLFSWHILCLKCGQKSHVTQVTLESFYSQNK